jgi:hypothetical protein
MALVMITSLAACREPATRSARKSLEELAAGWSGGRANPTCRNRGPIGEYLGTTPGAEYCQWPTLVRGAEWGTVGGQRDSIFGMTMITWQRKFRSAAGANWLIDSLGKEFRAQGFREWPCPNGGRRWETNQLGVLIERLVPKTGTEVLTVFATTMPQALPEKFCPVDRRFGPPEPPVKPKSVT